MRKWLPWEENTPPWKKVPPPWTKVPTASVLSGMADGCNGVLPENRSVVEFHSTFSRHGIAQILSALALLIWLDEKVGFHPTFSRLGIAQSLQTLALHIWLDDKVFAHPDAINF